jgi:beta-lactamase regulating signal transducer with metallopeptidase domain
MPGFDWMMGAGSEWLAWLAESSVRATVLLGAAWVACFMLRRRSAAVRHLIWTLSLAAVVATPLSLNFAPKLSVAASWWPAPGPVAVESNVERFEAGLQPLAHRGDDSRMVRMDAGPINGEPSEVQAAGLTPGPAVPASAVAESAEARSAPTLATLLLGAWALGCCVFVSWLLIGHLRLRKMARGARVVHGAPAAGCEDTGSNVRFLQAAGETMPMTWGWRKPVILLPASFEKWDQERRAMTVYHELAHVHRADWLTQTLAQLVRAVYWFHPVVWLALGRMRVEADRACDDMVLRAGVKASGYAGHLVQAAREFRTAGLRPWVAIAMAHPSSLNQRVQYVLDGKVQRAGPGRWSRFAVALSIAAAVLLAPSLEAVGQTSGPSLRPQAAAALRTVPQVAAERAVAQNSPAVGETLAPVAARTEGQIERRAKSPINAAGAVTVRVQKALLAQAPQVRSQVRLRAQAAVAQAAVAQTTPEPVLVQDVEAQVREEVERNMEEAQRRAQTARREAERQMRIVETRVRVQQRPRLSPEAMQTASTALRKALGSGDANVRAEAAEALGRLGSIDEANLEALAAALADAEIPVQRNAVESLGRLLQSDENMPADRAVNFLTPALRSTDAGVRREAVEALGGLRGPAAIDAAIRMVGDADAEVQREAIDSLGRVLRSSDPQTARPALPVLQKALQSSEPNVRRQIVETLGRLRSIADEVVPLLAKAIEDPDPEVQRQAVEALGAISSR